MKEKGSNFIFLTGSKKGDEIMWVITKDSLYKKGITERSDVGISSRDYVEGSELPYRFRLLDDDRIIYYYGKSSTDDDFEPQDWGMWNAGVTMIQYYNPSLKQWETL
jgi:hypothetical protein